MSSNPFQIIRPTEEPPEHLRGEVLSSVRSAILLMRLAQLFVADFAHSIFDKLSAVDRAHPDPDPSTNDPSNPS
ncbi:MAG: hypothetical protein IPJ85_17340 [Flavobacteriales bacterium]|nr:hypothetical protein [Flavobacteriales bacterium]